MTARGTIDVRELGMTCATGSATEAARAPLPDRIDGPLRLGGP